MPNAAVALRTRFSLRPLAALALAGLLAACSTSGAELGEMQPELGDFRLCYNIVTTNDAVQGPLSREADLDVFADRIRDQIDRRFGRYEGTRLYHIAIHLDAYVLAVPGIPLVASPRSALIISTNLWDDRLGRPLNDEPEQFTVLESASGSSVLGSGLTQSADQQMTQLAENAAKRIEEWMQDNPAWFSHPEDMPETRETTEAAAPAEPEGQTPVSTSAPAGTTAGGGCGRR